MYGKQNRNSNIFSLNMYIYIIYKIYGVYMGSGRGGGADQKEREKKNSLTQHWWTKHVCILFGLDFIPKT